MKRTLFLIISYIGLGPLVGCSERQQTLTLLFSNNAAGEIRACGCAAQDYGGLGRRATFLERSRRDGNNFLLLESGDFFGPDVNYAEEKARLTLHAMSFMGYHGIVLGEKDLGFGLDYVVERVDALKLPVLVANLYDAETDELIFASTRTVKLDGGLKVGLIGVMGDRLKLPEGADADRIRFEDPRTAIEREIPTLEDEVDLIVVLAHMQTGNARRLAEAIPDIDIVTAGHEGRAMRRIRKFGNAYVLQSSSRGRFMGRADALIGPDKNIVDLVAEIHPLTNDYEDHTSILKLFEAYDMGVAATERGRIQAADRRAKTETPYATADACQTCHPDVYQQWQGTRHAHAFDILTSQNREFDRDCTPCHTTGFYDLGGFLSTVETPDLVHVQCESCHGNGQEHAKKPTVKTPGNVRQVCLTCHTTDQTPDFEFSTFWNRIRH